TIALRTSALSPPVRRSSPITMLAGIGLVGLVLFAVLLYNGLRSLGGAVPSSGEPSVIGVASPSPSPSLKPSVVTSPSPSPSHRPTPSPTRTATPDPFAEARNRLADVRAAIEAARGGGGLRGKDANHLRAL